MGKAIIVPGADFSGLGMGKVHLVGEIDAPKIIVGQSCTPTAGFANAIWSVDDDTYATINSSTGVLTIKSVAWGNKVTVTATSENKSASAEIELYYSTVDSMTFEEAETVDNTSNFRNGSPGNTQNQQRIGNTKTIGIGNWRYVAARTNRPADTGYQYSAVIYLFTSAAETTTGSLANYQICEMNTSYAGTTTSNGIMNPPLERLLPLFEDTDLEEWHNASAMTGESPVSFALAIDEPDNTHYYANAHALRIGDFSGYKIELTFFK